MDNHSIDSSTIKGGLINIFIWLINCIVVQADVELTLKIILGAISGVGSFFWMLLQIYKYKTRKNDQRRP